MRFARLFAMVVVSAPLLSCGDGGSKGPSIEAPPASSPNSVEAKDALAVLHLFSKAIKKSAVIARLAEDYREDRGTKMSQGTTRRGLMETLLVSAPEVLEQQGRSIELVVTNGERGLRVSRVTRLRSHASGRDITGSYLEAHLYRFVPDESGGLPKIASRSHYVDTATVFRQAGLEGMPPGPVLEPDWPGDVIEAAATGSETEAARIARANELVKRLAERDLAAAELVAPSFTDRDVTRIKPQIYPQPGDFEASLASEYSRLELSRLEALEVWAAEEWVVLRIRHAYRLVADLAEAGGARALNYELWVLRFEGERIAARWRFRDALDEHMQLGLGTINELVRRAREKKE